MEATKKTGEQQPLPGTAPASPAPTSGASNAADQAAPASNAAGQGSISVQSIHLPQGGGAIRGIGETFQTNPFSGTAGLSVPIMASPCRDFAPQLQLAYSTGSGNGPWGMGWSLALPNISRQTRQGTPQYQDTDVFVLSGAADLVPLEQAPRTEKLQATTYTIQTYRPRQEGLFALIEYWKPTKKEDSQAGAFWKVTDKAHIVSIYGKTDQAKIADPGNPAHVFTWLLEESYNAQGDHQLFFYKPENTENVPEKDYEQGHVQTANRYIERIRYGNATAIPDALVLTDHAALSEPTQWHFEVVFDYGEYNIEPSNATPYTPVREWKARPDHFSTYHAGFEIRTHRRCHHTLMFHRFQDELGDQPVLVHAIAYEYQLNYAHMSECISITNTGYTYDPAQETYTTAALPPLSLQYTPFQPTGHDFVPLTTTQAQTLQGLDNPPHHTLVDLFGEGIPGILYTDGASTYYRDPVLTSDTDIPTASAGAGIHPLSQADTTSRAVGYGMWQELASFPAPKRVAGDEGVTLQDINGNAQLDIVMATPTGMRGYWEAQPDRSWQDFQAFEAWPAEYPAPAQTWVDMTGDGIADLVQLTAQEVRVYPSARSQGLGKAIVQQNQGLPPSLAGSPTEVVQFADMAGSGQAHLVRIRNKEVVYWPNLSYGRLGEPITMAHAPDFGQDFNSARLFLADLDGSGTTDLIYMEPTQATIYFNQSGNAFRDPVVLPLPFAFDDLDQVTLADVYGRGNACLVISEPHHLPEPKHWCYDFCQGQKPYLLNQLANNLGATTAITYGSSVDFYLADKAADLPWITALPLPVQVVTQITHTDAIAGTRYVSQYAYHHGYYDGVEREFRGFGRVDRQDSEYFPPSKIDPDKQPEYVAPSLSRTWYHTGAYRAGAALSQQYASEYYSGDKQALAFPDRAIDWGNVTPDEETQRQAAVAMAGTVLRTELYGLDDDAPAAHPYTVSESNFRVLLKQDKGENPYAIFFVHPAQSLTYTYERDPQDPQIRQETTLQVDDYGNVEQSCAISYPRRVIPTELASLAQEFLEQGQGQVRATLALHAYANKTTPAEYLLGVAVESQSYELSSHLQKIYQSGKPFTLQAVKQLVDGIFGNTTPTPLNLPPAGVPLLSWERLYYAPVAASGSAVLPLGTVALPLLLAEHHVAEFSQDQVAAALKGALAGDALTQKLKEGHYQLDTSNYWWNPGLTEHYFGAAQFYLPQATVDPDGNQTQYSYDTYHLLLTEVKDALNNTVQATAIDYQHLHPRQLIDANKNTSEVKLDPLGRVVYTSHYGHEAGKPQGFAPLSEAPTFTPSSLQGILAEPAKYLGKTQSYFYYDPLAWQQRQEPVRSLALVAEQYPDSTNAPATPPIQIHLTYNDGLGRNLCTKSQVEPGKAFLYDATTKQVTEGTTQDRWLTTGRTGYNNKGNPVKQYEPYYIDTPNYVSNAMLDTFGVSPTLYYDPLDRPTKVLTAKGFWTTHTWTAWEEAVYDQNDTLKDSPYYQDNIVQPDPQSPFHDPDLTAASRENLKYVVQHFADTPRRSVLDNLGNTIVEERINQSADKPKGETLQTHHTYDILGRELTSADPRLYATQRHNFETVYSLVGHILQVKSADAGTRWALTNTWGNPIWAYDERQITITTTYDALHRPTQVQVHKPATAQDPLALDQVVERFIYGDTPGAVTDPAQHNLRGQLYQHYDPAGRVTTPSYSLLGKPLESQRQFRVAYQAEADWHDTTTLASLLQDTTYTEQMAYDALGRITQETDADDNQTAPQYHISGRLNQITLTPKDDGQAVQVVQSITYNAKSQREQITYGNTTTTTYTYDPKTWAVTHIQTQNSQGKKLQDLSYVYDPVGNVVVKTDAAEDTVFHNNQKVEATATYTYDSLYRLIQATGREKAGGSEATAGQEIPLVAPSPHAHDNQALQNYVERYSYDSGNNLTQTKHMVNSTTSWTRDMIVAATSNRAVLSTINGSEANKSTSEQVDQYFDKHGNQIQTQQLHPLAWDYRDNLQRGTVVERSSGKHDAEYYVYDGRGQRVRKVQEQYGHNGQVVTLQETLYLGRLEYRRTLQGADPASATVTKEYHALRVLDDRQCVATRDHWVQGNPPSGFQNPTLRYHLDDHLGSCTVEVDERGNPISREEYSPYGSSTLFMGTGSASQLKHYRYSGQERDSVTGFYYYGARYYAPWLARWLSPDPAGTVDGLNLYAFVSNNPETFGDVGGRMLSRIKSLSLSQGNNNQGSNQRQPAPIRQLRVVFGGTGRSAEESLNSPHNGEGEVIHRNSNVRTERYGDEITINVNGPGYRDESGRVQGYDNQNSLVSMFAGMYGRITGEGPGGIAANADAVNREIHRLQQEGLINHEHTSVTHSGYSRGGVSAIYSANYTAEQNYPTSVDLRDPVAGGITSETLSLDQRVRGRVQYSMNNLLPLFGAQPIRFSKEAKIQIVMTQGGHSDRARENAQRYLPAIQVPGVFMENPNSTFESATEERFNIYREKDRRKAAMFNNMDSFGSNELEMPTTSESRHAVMIGYLPPKLS